MKKLIIGLLLIGGGALAGQLDYTTEQVNTVIGDDIAQYGAGGYLASPTLNDITAGVWHPFTNGTFTIPFVSGFEFVANSTIRYINGPRWFKMTGSVGISSGIAQTTTLEVGIETNGIYVAGSTSGPRNFSSDGESGSMSFQVPIYLTSNDTVGLVIKGDKINDPVVNTWQSNITRY